MSESNGPKQLLHLVFGGELEDLEHTDFRNLDELDIVGIYASYAEAEKVWRQNTKVNIIRAERYWPKVLYG